MSGRNGTRVSRNDTALAGSRPSVSFGVPPQHLLSPSLYPGLEKVSRIMLLSMLPLLLGLNSSAHLCYSLLSAYCSKKSIEHILTIIMKKVGVLIEDSCSTTPLVVQISLTFLGS